MIEPNCSWGNNSIQDICSPRANGHVREVFLESLPPDIDEETLYRELSYIGPVSSILIHPQCEDGYLTPALVKFMDPKSARRAVDEGLYIRDYLYHCCSNGLFTKMKDMPISTRRYSIFLKGLSADITERQLFQYFTRGGLGPLYFVCINRYSDGASKGTALVIFRSHQAANHLISHKIKSSVKQLGQGVKFYKCLEKKNPDDNISVEYMPRLGCVKRGGGCMNNTGPTAGTLASGASLHSQLSNHGVEYTSVRVPSSSMKDNSCLEFIDCPKPISGIFSSIAYGPQSIISLDKFSSPDHISKYPSRWSVYPGNQGESNIRFNPMALSVHSRMMARLLRWSSRLNTFHSPSQ